MKIVILTNAFPWFPGEQFLEDEIVYWARCPHAQVTVMPAVIRGEPRPLPEGVSVDPGMANASVVNRLGFIVRGAFTRMFRDELGYLRRSGRLRWQTILRALLHVSKVLQQARAIERHAERHGVIDIVYSYWNDTQAYAAVVARDAGAARRAITRAHGIDLYQERRAYDYMPLKRQFVGAFDRVFALSTEAQQYLQRTYDAPPSKIDIVPLGVPLTEALSRPSPEGSVHVVSVSFCLPVKRMDRIIEAMRLFALAHPDVKATWTHIGVGPLLDEMRQLAEDRLGGLRNVQYAFMGELPNDAVKKYYLNTPVDIFINTSESEAIPVSIMEAMSTGVLAIAPDVGGISNLVSDRVGVLLSSRPSHQEIADAIAALVIRQERKQLRANARRAVEERFNAAKNYPSFIESVLSIGAS